MSIFAVSSQKLQKLRVSDSVNDLSINGFMTETYFYSKLWCLLSQFYINFIAFILQFFLW